MTERCSHYRVTTIWYSPEGVGDQWSLIGTLAWRHGARVILRPYPIHPAPLGEMARWAEIVRRVNVRHGYPFDKFIDGFKNGLPSPHGGSTLISAVDVVEAANVAEVFDYVLAKVRKRLARDERRRSKSVRSDRCKR